MERPRACKTINELSVGERFERDYSVSEDDVLTFGKLSGDFNPVHFEDEYARKTMFGRKIAHGMISLAKFSGIFGMDMPGLGTLWLSQSVHFHRPVFIGQQYRAIAEITSVDRRRATIATWVEDEEGHRVLSGEGVVIPITDQAKKALNERGSKNAKSYCT